MHINIYNVAYEGYLRRPMKEIILKKGRDEAIRRKSPWIFSGAVLREIGDPNDGDEVKVLDTQGELLGVGHYQEGGIRVRMLGLGEESISEDFFFQKISTALNLRKQLGLITDPLTNAYRLVHAAGDHLPGLIIDKYDKTVVIQCHSIGMHQRIESIVLALQKCLGNQVTAIYDKSTSTLPERYARNIEDKLIWGQELSTIQIQENGRRFLVDVHSGQKTGFFLDQRINRWLLGSYCENKRVLNTFSYTGGFSIYALAGGATEVISIDASQKALELAAQNVEANGDLSAKHTSVQSDVLEWLKDHQEDKFDIVIVDPPAYAKNKHKRHKAVQAYKRLNATAIKNIVPGGLLFTFSCSRVVDRELFLNTIVAAGLESGRNCRILHYLSQGADHPVNLFHTDSSYLKGLVVRVD